MGAVKALAESVTSAGMTLVELQDSGVQFVLTAAQDGWAWFIAPDSDEYTQDDWVFHALRHGKAPSFDDAVTALAQATVMLLPDTPFATARRPILRPVK